MSNNLYPEHVSVVGRGERESCWGHRGLVVWLYGLSGSGKSTLAHELERQLIAAGKVVLVLDADIVRSGLNSDLGFSDDDRWENLRRLAEVAAVLVRQGAIVIVTAITPKEEFRQKVRVILGADLFFVGVRASYDECARRDPKGLYARVAQGQVKAFSGKDSGFDEPVTADCVIDTEGASIEQSHQQLMGAIGGRLAL